MATKADVITILTNHPTFASVYAGATAYIDAYIVPQAVAKHPDSVWGDDADMAAALYAAHQYTLQARASGSAAGAVVSESVGGVSRSYQQVNAEDALMASTVYGQQYLQLRSELCVTPLVIDS